ncbi:DNA-binding protein [Streptomyces sp. H27-D2]|uniref:DNA-binding protein n=1 Tax=Streptomyces sp. H27-D2 TaxID=3046304 RepID=UPI002DB9061E|nr:DNA-binding protein [Streptomyces sp. H27-D2]MEC4016007.1 DNA-binding protein [Streptomyces sp. H27-D2]
MPTAKTYHLPIKPEDPNAEYMTIQETAWDVKCSVTHLRRGLKSGLFSARRNGDTGPWIFDRADRDHIHAVQRIGGPRRASRRTRKPTTPKTNAA